MVDDGCGIQSEDLPLAFASQATSKLADVKGLFHIGTLGFRGEALIFIGSIAQVSLQSRPLDQQIQHPQPAIACVIVSLGKPLR